MRTTFGSSCEPGEESEREKRQRERREHRVRREPEKNCFERLVELCSVRDRSCAELRERLGREGYRAQVVDEAVRRACDCGLVDDGRFAEGFIRGRVSAGKGISAVVRELAKHGIEAETIEGWPDEFGLDADSQVERALQILNAHPPRAKDVWGAAYRKLISKGYPRDVSYRAVSQWVDARE